MWLRCGLLFSCRKRKTLQQPNNYFPSLRAVSLVLHNPETNAKEEKEKPSAIGEPLKVHLFETMTGICQT